MKLKLVSNGDILTTDIFLNDKRLNLMREFEFRANSKEILDFCEIKRSVEKFRITELEEDSNKIALNDFGDAMIESLQIFPTHVESHKRIPAESISEKEIIQTLKYLNYPVHIAPEIFLYSDGWNCHTLFMLDGKRIIHIDKIRLWIGQEYDNNNWNWFIRLSVDKYIFEKAKGSLRMIREKEK